MLSRSYVIAVKSSIIAKLTTAIKPSTIAKLIPYINFPKDT